MGKDYYGGDINERPTRSRTQCVDFCLSIPACNGASFSTKNSMCYIKTIVEGAKPMVDVTASMLKLCPGQWDAISSGLTWRCSPHPAQQVERGTGRSTLGTVECCSRARILKVRSV